MSRTFLVAASCALVSLTVLPEPSAGSELKGRVEITRALTRDRISIDAYDGRGAALVHRRLMGSSEGELSHVVVYLEGKGLPPAKPVKAELMQRDRHFDPEILMIPVGSTVGFPNDDPIFHNVFSLSKARSFDLGYYPQGKTRSVRFTKPGTIQVYCHLHPNMSAALVVVPTVWFGQPDSDGEFSFENVPPGPVNLVVWHKSAGTFRRRLIVPQSGTVEISIQVPVRNDPESSSVAESR
jgi:plastocyanin